MKTSTVVVILVAILIIAGGAWWYTQTNAPAPVAQTPTTDTANVNDSTPPSTNTSTSTATTTPSGSGTTVVDVGVSAGAATAKTVTVTYNSSTGFSPKSITVNKGDTVKFVAEAGSMWVGVDEHPSHTGYDGTSRSEHCVGGAPSATVFDQCSTGASYNFTFNKTGTWDYHNHVGAAQVGTVVVK